VPKKDVLDDFLRTAHELVQLVFEIPSAVVVAMREQFSFVFVNHLSNAEAKGVQSAP
jgi:signal transduction histidine kinase